MKTLFFVLAFLVVSCTTQKKPKFTDNVNLNISQSVVYKNTKNKDLNQKHSTKNQNQKSKELNKINSIGDKNITKTKLAFKFY